MFTRPAKLAFLELSAIAFLVGLMDAQQLAERLRLLLGDEQQTNPTKTGLGKRNGIFPVALRRVRRPRRTCSARFSLAAPPPGLSPAPPAAAEERGWQCRKFPASSGEEVGHGSESRDRVGRVRRALGVPPRRPGLRRLFALLRRCRASAALCSAAIGLDCNV